MSRAKSIPTSGVTKITLWVPRAHIPARWQGKRVTKGGAKSALSYGAYIRAILEAVAEVQNQREERKAEQEEPERAQEVA